MQEKEESLKTHWFSNAFGRKTLSKELRDIAEAALGEDTEERFITHL